MNKIGHSVSNNALDRALEASLHLPELRQKVPTKDADKIILRGNKELFSALFDLGLYHGRCRNSEVIAAITEAVTGFERANAMLRILKSSLGDEIANRVLEELPDLKINTCVTQAKFNLRLPRQVREEVRVALMQAASNNSCEKPQSMNLWLLQASVSWVIIQRQLFALLSAAISIEKENSISSKMQASAWRAASPALTPA